MVKKPYTFKSKNFYQLQFFFLISRLFTIQFPGVLLFIFIIKFYLIDNTYEYNKLLLVWQNCMINYLILFVHAFNDCCLNDL